MKYHVKKYNGELVEFSKYKLEASLRNAGSTSESIIATIKAVESILYDGIPTKEIYTKAHQILKKHQKQHAAIYKLKKAILKLGPTGYPFEIFVGELMKAQLYSVNTGVTIDGKCVSHEVDVMAINQSEVHLMECKYHNRHGYKTDVKVTLYVKSRFEDLKSQLSLQEENKGKTFSGWVVTNSRLTSDAIDYGTCAGLKLLSWDYPLSNSLKLISTRNKIFPITILSLLTKKQFDLLFEKGIVTLQQLNEHLESLQDLNLDQKRKAQVTNELHALLST